MAHEPSNYGHMCAAAFRPGDNPVPQLRLRHSNLRATGTIKYGRAGNSTVLHGLLASACARLRSFFFAPSPLPDGTSPRYHRCRRLSAPLGQAAQFRLLVLFRRHLVWCKSAEQAGDASLPWSDCSCYLFFVQPPPMSLSTLYSPLFSYTPSPHNRLYRASGTRTSTVVSKTPTQRLSRRELSGTLCSTSCARGALATSGRQRRSCRILFLRSCRP